jgi:hypothetical protein
MRDTHRGWRSRTKKREADSHCVTENRPLIGHSQNWGGEQSRYQFDILGIELRNHLSHVGEEQIREEFMTLMRVESTKY